MYGKPSTASSTKESEAAAQARLDQVYIYPCYHSFALNTKTIHTITIVNFYRYFYT